jgi:pimeloyl-ACP methyl ester carboxylesterase
VHFEITEGLDKVWGYDGTYEDMRKVIDYFAYSRALVTDELAKVRYEASNQPGFQESFSSMFPAPRQRWVEAMATPDEDIKALPHRTLIVHGREDRVIPLETSLKLLQLLDNADLAVFSHCGHWSMIERTADFNRLVRDFFLGK